MTQPSSILRRLRPATERDWSAIADIAFRPDNLLAQLSPYRNWTVDHVLAIRKQIVKSWRDRLAEGRDNVVYVAEDEPDGRVVGYVMVTLADAPVGRQGWIMELGVDPHLWGRGLATALMAKAEEHCRAKGARYMALGVSSSNERAIRLYDRLGYREERRHLVKVL